MEPFVPETPPPVQRDAGVRQANAQLEEENSNLKQELEYVKLQLQYVVQTQQQINNLHAQTIDGISAQLNSMNQAMLLGFGKMVGEFHAPVAFNQPNFVSPQPPARRIRKPFKTALPVTPNSGVPTNKTEDDMDPISE